MSGVCLIVANTCVRPSGQGINIQLIRNIRENTFAQQLTLDAADSVTKAVYSFLDLLGESDSAVLAHTIRLFTPPRVF